MSIKAERVLIYAHCFIFQRKRSSQLLLLIRRIIDVVGMSGKIYNKWVFNTSDLTKNLNNLSHLCQINKHRD
jgi:hypothetical protein